MKTLTSKLLPIFFVFAIVFACKKSDPVNFHFNYYPIVQGNYVVYKVQDINIDLIINKNDTTNYYVKAKIGDTLHDNEGRIVRRYERYYGPTAGGPWTLHDIWTTILNMNKAELVEENNRTIKMVFAPTKYQEWDANAYNTMGESNSFYSNIHLPYTINGLSFDSTVTVNVDQIGPDINFIQHRQKYEMYAKGVGMIKKVFVDCEINNYDTLQITKGHKFYMDIVGYGHE